MQSKLLSRVSSLNVPIQGKRLLVLTSPYFDHRVGKTELCKALAAYMFDTEEALVSDFKHGTAETHYSDFSCSGMLYIWCCV